MREEIAYREMQQEGASEQRERATEDPTLKDQQAQDRPAQDPTRKDEDDQADKSASRE